ncbi:MAG: hypothetical protein M3Q10_20275 [Chloroflexota bacterium]|nr:hypothetical protein [Chloroflexota bacterium]
MSFYVGAEEENRPGKPTRIVQGLVVGLLVTAGFLGVFVAVGLPIMYGAALVAEAMPWAGLAVGVTLAGVGLVALTGRHVSLPIRSPLPAGHDRRANAMVLFGVGYGTASLGCTLPAFLALLGAGLGAGGMAASLAVFAAYGAGMAAVLMALSVGAVLLRRGLARGLKRVAPHMPRIAGGLLLVAGVYLTYYWSRLLFGPSATLASDPVVGSVTRVTARIEALAADRGLPLVLGAGLVAAVAGAAGWWQSRRRGLEGGAGRASRIESLQHDGLQR